MRTKTLLGQRAAIWVLNQALPDAPDLTTLLRATFVTIAVGAAAGVAAVALAGVVLLGLHQLAASYIGPWAALTTLACALLLVGGCWYAIDQQIKRWGARRQLLRSQTDPLAHARDMAESIIGGFLSGLTEDAELAEQVRAKVVKLRRKVVG